MFISILPAILGPALLPLFAAAGPIGFVLFAFLYSFVWGFEHLWF